MDENKKNLVITGVLIFFIMLIGWGFFQTAVKLSQKKPPSQPPTNIAAISPRNKEAKKEAPQQKVAQKTAQKVTPASNNQEPQAKPEQPIAVMEPLLTPVRTLKVNLTDFQDLLPVMGTVKGKTDIELKFEINGVIQKINFREGDSVKKDSPIANINPADARLRLEYAKNKLSSAGAAYNSIAKKLEVHRQLYAAGAIIKTKLEEVEMECESAKFQVETTKNEMQLAANEIEKTTLYAPIDGIMGQREAEEGEFVTPQDKIGSLLDISDVYVDVGVVERDIEKIKIGQKAVILVDAYPDKTFAGAVKHIFPSVEGKSRTLTIKIIVANPLHLLLPGMFSRSEITIAELKGVIMVPFSALSQVKNGTALAPVISSQSIVTDKAKGDTGTIELKKLSLGYVTTDYAQITSGLSSGDLLVIEAQGEIKYNEKARIIEAEEMAF